MPRADSAPAATLQPHYLPPISPTSVAMNVIVVGPLPPAIGGIASITATLYDAFRSREDVVFVESTKHRGSTLRRWTRPMRVIAKLLSACVRFGPARVLMFSSSWGSFWEKMCWTAICRLYRSPVTIVMVSGDFPLFYSSLRPSVRRLATVLMSNVDTLATQSPSWMTYYRAIFPRANVVTVAAGVDTDFFVPPYGIRTDSEPVRILYVGWLIEDKGVLDLLAAVELVHRRGVTFRCRLVGPTFGRDAFFVARIDELGLSGTVEIAGVAPSAEALRNEYQAADIFVLPSHFEGLPVALQEALASGLPCVGTEVGGVPDILDHGSCGVLVEAQNPEALADALAKLVEDAPRRHELGRLARERAERNYTLAEAVASYRELLGI